MNRKVFSDIETTYELEKILEKSGIAENSSEHRELQKALPLLRQYIRPRAVIKRCILENSGGRLLLNGLEARRNSLEERLRLLEGNQEIVLGVITAGDEVDYIGSITSERVFNALKLATLASAVEYISRFLRAEWGYRRVGWISPGLLEGLPVEENRLLFRAIGNVFEDIGVELDPDYLMRPDFTISAFFYEEAEGAPAE